MLKWRRVSTFRSSRGDLSKKFQMFHLGICWTICACSKNHISVSRVEAMQIMQQPPHFLSALKSNEAKLVSNVTGCFMPATWWLGLCIL